MTFLSMLIPYKIDAKACLAFCRKIQRVLVVGGIYVKAGEKFVHQHFCINFIYPGPQQVHIPFSEDRLPHDFSSVVGQHFEDFLLGSRITSVHILPLPVR